MLVTGLQAFHPKKFRSCQPGTQGSVVGKIWFKKIKLHLGLFGSFSTSVVTETEQWPQPSACIRSCWRAWLNISLLGLINSTGLGGEQEFAFHSQGLLLQGPHCEPLNQRIAIFSHFKLSWLRRFQPESVVPDWSRSRSPWQASGQYLDTDHRIHLSSRLGAHSLDAALPVSHQVSPPRQHLLNHVFPKFLCWSPNPRTSAYDHMWR